MAYRSNAIHLTPARVGAGAAVFVLALFAAIGVWTVVFSAGGGYAVGAIVAAPLSAFALAGAFWITCRYHLSGLWGLGALLGLMYPIILWTAILVIFGLPEMD
jgi:hypothetical protein